MPNDLPSINFIDKQAPFLDRFMDWTLTIGRLIVIITEVIAVIAFIYRFSLDEKLIDLHSVIKQKQNIISVLKNDENKYRNLQDRIALAATFSEKANKSNQTITDIAGLLPKQARINNLILNKNQLNIDINVSSVFPLASLINSLKNYSGVKSISINSIESKPSVGLSASITTMLK